MIGDEHAKAAQEIAKTTGKGIDAASEAGSFISRTFGSAIQHFSEAIADKAAGYKIKNRYETMIKTKIKLEKLGIKNISQINLREGIVLIESIDEEDDLSIQNVWSNYIINCVDNNINVNASKKIIEIIRNLQPEDLSIIEMISIEDLEAIRKESYIIDYKSVNLSNDDAILILSRLASLGLFYFTNTDTLLWTNEDEGQPCRINVVTSLGEFRAMPMLLIFKRAIAEPQSPMRPEGFPDPAYRPNVQT